MVILRCSKFSYLLAWVYCIFLCFSHGFDFVFPANLKRLVARKNISELTYFVSSGM